MYTLDMTLNYLKLSISQKHLSRVYTENNIYIAHTVHCIVRCGLKVTTLSVEHE